MLRIRLICVGKMKERHYISAFDEYEMRLKPHCRLETVELAEERLPEAPSEKEISAALSREAAEILKRIPQSAYVIALCVEGKQLSSTELAELFSDCASRGHSRLCFIVGSSNGLGDEIKKVANLMLSVSKMTFPHHLARIILVEQIYRGIMINEGSKYHK